MLPLLVITGCKKEGGGTGVFLFSIQDDIDLGKKVDGQIKESGEFNIMDRGSNTTAYGYIEAMRDDLLNGGELKFGDEFPWELNLIDNDSVLNAFCTPGGYIYIYSGLIKYLENSSSLAGVLGHEMAHADRRHSSKQMQQQFGISVILSLLSNEEGDPGLLPQIAASLTSLAFSRADETQADQYSVKYLCPTDFDAAGASNFFQKIKDSGNPTPPQFLSTHPSPENRVAKIKENAEERECAPDEEDPLVNGLTYAQFQALF